MLAQLTSALLALLLAEATIAAPPTAVTLGIDVLLSEHPELLAGKRVGLVTNHSGVDGQLVTTARRLAAAPGIDLVRLYAPEHGLEGVLSAGEKLDDSVDPATGVPVESLFKDDKKRPSVAALQAVDVLVFDIQDVGSRAYTYITTLGEVLVAAGEAGVPVVVLDRPNPQGGWLFEGPVREARRKSFVSWGPIPVTHGMTVGELARLYRGELGIDVGLTVIPMRGWHRTMTWEDTGLSWVPTSPGIPSANSARLFPATGMFAGVTTNVNEGVGATWPFETLAADFIDGRALAGALNAAALPGVRFRPLRYRPFYHRFRRQVLSGVQLHVTDPRAFRPIRTALTLMTTVERLYPGKTAYRSAGYVARIWGTDAVLRDIRAGRGAAAIEATWKADHEDFARRRAGYLLYR